MSRKRTVEIFTAGCPVCDDAVRQVRKIACPSCDVQVLDMRDAHTAQRAAGYGVRSVPAVVIDGKLADCCVGGVEEASLRAAGVGTPLP